MNIFVKQKRKTLHIKIKDGNPSIKNTRQMRAQEDIMQRKIKTNNQQKSKNLMQIEPMAMK
jgi:hypothetical protein